MACIPTHLISGASGVSLVPRPEKRTRLLSSSLRGRLQTGSLRTRLARALLSYRITPPEFDSRVTIGVVVGQMLTDTS